MQINVTVEGIESVDLTTVVGNEGHADPITLGDMIADRAVRNLSYEGRSGLDHRIQAIRDEEIREAVKPIVFEALDQAVQQTNHWGETSGKPTTLRELIVKEAKELLNRPVDQYHRNKGTVLEKAVRDVVDKAIRVELDAVLADEKAKVVAAVRAKAADLIATAVKEGVGGRR